MMFGTILRHVLSCAIFCVCANASGAVTPCVAEDLSGVAVTPNVDFSTTIQPIFNARCSGCHTGGARLGGLSLDHRVAIENLVNAPSTITAAGMPRVTPGDPADSFLFEKINCTNLGSIAGLPYGVRMPESDVSLPFQSYLTPTQQAAIRDWIAQGALAAANTPPPGPPISSATSGAWYNKDQSGHGFLIQVLPGNVFLATWFVFTPDGSAQSWIYIQDPYDPTSNSVTIQNALIEQGGSFPPDFDSTKVTRNNWGPITFTFTDCNNGNVSWNSSLSGYGTGSLAIKRLAGIDGLTCQ